ncbi:hypothetical protein GCM10010439_70450 [Actinocorallia aurantiaca]|uniref:Uncharacterized protein n=1 Tax=Actinocorallia aurantiaca TaxID=46204 RepID=A0ABN3UT35_9ACTN
MPAVDGKQRGEHPKRRGLACPIGPQNPEDFTLPHLKVDPVHSPEVPEIFDQPVDPDGTEIRHNAPPP